MPRSGLFVLILFLALGPTPLISGAESASVGNGVQITWYGHSCFLIADEGGHQILTDPFDPTIGYAYPRVEPTVVLVSHDHFDHNATSLLHGSPPVVTQLGDTMVGGIAFSGILSWHDDQQGRLRGRNIIFIWEMGGLKFAHLGDLGQSQLTPVQRRALAHVDVLFIPVGGVYTITGTQALKIVKDVLPRLVIPMHYKTASLTIDLQPVDSFLKGPFPVDRQGARVKVTPNALPPKTRILLMDFSR